MELWPSRYCTGLKYLCDYRTNNYNSIWPGIKIEIEIEAGPVEQSSAEAKSLKTKGQETVRLPPQWATTEQPDKGPKGQNKELLSRQFTKKKQSLKQLWLEAL